MKINKSQKYETNDTNNWINIVYLLLLYPQLRFIQLSPNDKYS